MPDGLKTVDDLYGAVASNKPGLTKDQFQNDMYDSQKSYRLYNNLKQAGDKSIPSTYKDFVNQYGFNKPPAPPKDNNAPPTQQTAEAQPPSLYDPANPEYIKQQLEADAQKTKETTDRALLLTGLFKKGPDGNPVLLDPHANPDSALSAKADETFKKILIDKKDPLFDLDNNFDTYLNSYYNAKDPLDRKRIGETIKKLSPEWTPLTDAQHKALQDAKLGMYKNYLLSHADNDAQSQAVEEGMTAASNPLAGLVTGALVKKAGSEDINNDALTYARAAYTGQSAIDNPDHFWGAIYKSLPFTSKQTGVDYNENLKKIFTETGITPQTEGQAKEMNPTFSDKMKDVTGGLLGFVLPMVAGNYVGDAMKLTSIGNKMLASENRLTQMGGKFLNSAFTNVATMEYAGWRAPMHAAVSGLTFSAVDAALDKVGVKATSTLGKALGKYITDKGAAAVMTGVRGGVKGTATGVIVNAGDAAYNLAMHHIQNSPEFTRDMSKENPGGWASLLPITKDAMANVVAMGIFGTIHGAYDYESVYTDLKNNGFSKTADDLKQKVEDVKAQAPQVEGAINSIVSQPQNTHRAQFQEQTGTLDKTDDAVQISRVDKDETHLTDIKNTKDNPSDTRVAIKDFKDPDEAQSFVNQAKKRELDVKRMAIAGDKPQERVIAHDPDYPQMANRIVELSQKELNGEASPEDLHELASLEGQDPIKFLKKSANDAVNPSEKATYEGLLKDVQDKTEGGFGAYNEIALRNGEIVAMRAEGKDTKILEEQTAIDARKYGFKIHKENGELKVTDNRGEVIGTELKRSEANKNELIEKVNSDAPIDEIKDIANKDGFNAVTTKMPLGDEERVEIKDESGKTILTQNDKIRGINDFQNNTDFHNIADAIMKTNGDDFKPAMKLMDKDGIVIENDELDKGIRDIQRNNKSIAGERVLDAINKIVIDRKVPTSQGEMGLDDFKATTKTAKPGKNSPAYAKAKGSPAKSYSKEAVSTKTVERDAENWKKPEGLYKDMTDKELESELKKTGLPDKDRSMIENIQKSRQKKSPEIKPGGIDYFQGKKAEPEEGMTEEDVNRLVAEKSENPKEIIDTYEKERNKLRDKESAETTDKFIESAIGKTGVDVDSYKAFGDPKKVGMSIAKQFKKGGEKIDTIAKNASFERNPEGAGDEITPQNVVDYMEGKKYEPRRNALMKSLEERFKDITGQPLSQKQIDLSKKPQTKAEEVSTQDFWKNPDAYAAGIASKESKALTQSIMRGVNKLFGVKDEKQIAELPQKLQPLAKGYNNMKGEFIDSFNKHMSNPTEFKTDMLNKAVKYFDMSEASSDPDLKKEYDFASNSMMSISEAVKDSRDIKNYAKIINEQNSFMSGDKEYFGHDLQEMKAMADFKKPKAPMTMKEKSQMKSIIMDRNPDFAAALDYNESEDSKIMGLFRNINKGFSYMSTAHNFAPPEIQGKVRELIRNIKQHIVKNRTADMNYMHTVLSSIKDLKDKDSQDKVAAWMALGRRLSNREYTPGELERGETGIAGRPAMPLNKEEITAYHKAKELLHWAQNNYIETDKAHLDYEKMEGAKKRGFDTTRKDYIAKNEGYQPYIRKGDYAVSGHGLNDMTGNNSRYFSLHETKSEADAKAKELSAKGYVGLTPEGMRDEGKPVKSYKMERAEKLSMEEKKGIPALEALIDKMNLPEGEAKDLLQGKLDKIKKSAYNPSFMETMKDEEGNYIHGADEGWDNMVNSLEEFSHRSVHSKSRALAQTTYDKNKSFLSNSRYRDTKADMDAWMDNNMRSTILRPGMQQFQNVIYGAYLGFKPKQLVMNVLHNMLTTYPDYGNELGIIDKERMAKGEDKTSISEGGLLVGTRAWGDAANITAHIIKGGLSSPVSSLEKLAFHTLGTTANLEKTVFDKYSDFHNTEFGQVLNHLAANGTLDREFSGYMDGREAGERKGTATHGAATGYTDLFTRVHAATLGYHLAKLKGIEGEDMKNYVQNFVDKNKFEWGKANIAPFLRPITVGTGEATHENLGSKIVTNLIQGGAMFKQFMLQDLGWNVDMMRNAENKAKTAARIIIPRVAIGGGITKAVAAMGGVGVSALYGMYNAILGRETDENMRRDAIKAMGDKTGNTFSDAMTYGGGMMINTDTRGMMDAGTLFNEDMPLADQIGGVGTSAIESAYKSLHDFSNGDWRAGLEKMPGEIGSLTKAWHWLSIINNKENNLPGEKVLYEGMGTNIVPTYWDAIKKAAGFNTVDISKFYDAEAIKQKYIGDGDTKNPKGLKGEIGTDLYNYVRDNYDTKKAQIDAYYASPSEENFKKAFNDNIMSRVKDYNIGLRNEFYTALHAMNPKNFREGISVADQVRRYGIGMTWGDSAWDDSGNTNLSTDMFITKTINDAIQSKQLK